MPRPALSVRRQRRLPRIRTHRRREVLISPFGGRKSPRRRTRNPVRSEKAFRGTLRIHAETFGKNLGFPRKTALPLLRRKRDRARNRDCRRPHSKIRNPPGKGHCHRHARTLPPKRSGIFRPLPGENQFDTRLPLRTGPTGMNRRDRRKKVGCRGVSLIPAENRGRRPRSPELPRIRSSAFHRIRGASSLYRNRRLRRRASRIEKAEFPAGQEGRRPLNGHGQ